jgi:hypothetical protein
MKITFFLNPDFLTFKKILKPKLKRVGIKAGVGSGTEKPEPLPSDLHKKLFRKNRFLAPEPHRKHSRNTPLVELFKKNPAVAPLRHSYQEL